MSLISHSLLVNKLKESFAGLVRANHPWARQMRWWGNCKWVLCWVATGALSMKINDLACPPCPTTLLLGQTLKDKLALAPGLSDIHMQWIDKSLASLCWLDCANLSWICIPMLISAGLRLGHLHLPRLPHYGCANSSCMLDGRVLDAG